MRTPDKGIRSPIVRMPTRQGAKQDRGHCVLAVGAFVHEGRTFLRLRNSFGARWGVMGDFAMPLEDVCADQVHLLCHVPASAMRVKHARQ